MSKKPLLSTEHFTITTPEADHLPAHLHVETLIDPSGGEPTRESRFRLGVNPATGKMEFRAYNIKNGSRIVFEGEHHDDSARRLGGLSRAETDEVLALINSEEHLPHIIRDMQQRHPQWFDGEGRVKHTYNGLGKLALRE